MKVFQLAAAAVLSALRLVDGHGYVTSPRSLNFRASPGEEGGLGVDPTGNIDDENCPHCLNRWDENGACGTAGGKNDNNYDNWVQADGVTRIPFAPQNVVYHGDAPGEIVVDTTLDTYHMGHMELRYCANVADPTHDCFMVEGNELEFVRDLSSNGDLEALPDSNHPERAYYGPSAFSGGAAADRFYTFVYKLPAEITGQVVLQYQYVTANACNPPGYAVYFASAEAATAEDYSDWWNAGLPTCTAFPDDGNWRACGRGKDDRVCGESFRNCIEIEVV